MIIAFIDLDNFKMINDSHGHEAGDEFLIQVGQRIAQASDADDIAGRLGGDEFIVACPGTPREKMPPIFYRRLKGIFMRALPENML